MSEPIQGHLNEEQFANCALMVPDPAARWHLETCGLCRKELESFGASVETFANLSLDWANLQARPSLRATAATQRRNMVLTPSAWALAAVAALAVALPAWRNAHKAPVMPSTAAQVQTSDSVAQIADDNRFMQSVNIALASEDPSPLAEYRTSGPGATHHKPRLESSYR